MNSRLASVIMAGVAWTLLPISTMAQSPEERRQTVNEHVVGIVSSNITSSMTRLAQDLSYALNEEGKLRILAMLGRGSIGNIEDLLYLRGVDLALAQGDVLEFFKRTGAEEDVFDKIYCVAELGREEVHLLVRDEFTDISQLQGARINVGEAQGGSFLTASIVFDELGVKVDASNLSHADALPALLRGEIDGMLYATNAPIPLFSDISGGQGVHFIDIPADQISTPVYGADEITSEHYPKLMAPGDSVQTINLGTMLVGYNWRHDTERYANMRIFLDTLHAKLTTLRGESYHPAWRNFQPKWQVPGWNCYD